jgi:hypothetical protein
MKMWNVVKHLLLLALFPTLTSGFLWAQSAKKARPLSDNCETISGKLDVVGSEYSRKGTKDSFIIVVGSFSSAARSKSAESIIRDAIKYLVRFHGVDEGKFRFGTNRTLRASSEVEFFVNGQSTIVINVTQRSRLCFGMGETFKQ